MMLLSVMVISQILIGPFFTVGYHVNTKMCIEQSIIYLVGIWRPVIELSEVKVTWQMLTPILYVIF